MQIKIQEVPEYASIEIVGKTVDTIAGTIDRKPVSRLLLTTDDVAGKKLQVVGGDGTVIQTVSKADEVEVYVEFVGSIRALAGVKFYDAYVAPDASNEGITTLFTTECDKVDRLISCASRMSAVHPECDGMWKIVKADGSRVIVRIIDTELNERGMRI